MWVQWLWSKLYLTQSRRRSNAGKLCDHLVHRGQSKSLNEEGNTVELCTRPQNAERSWHLCLYFSPSFWATYNTNIKMKLYIAISIPWLLNCIRRTVVSFELLNYSCSVQYLSLHAFLDCIGFFFHKIPHLRLNGFFTSSPSMYEFVLRGSVYSYSYPVDHFGWLLHFLRRCLLRQEILSTTTWSEHLKAKSYFPMVCGQTTFDQLWSGPIDERYSMMGVRNRWRYH